MSCLQLFSSGCIHEAMIMCIGSQLILKYHSSLLLIHEVSVLMTDQKAHLSSHLRINTCITLYYYWLIISMDVSNFMIGCHTPC